MAQFYNFSQFATVYTRNGKATGMKITGYRTNATTGAKEYADIYLPFKQETKDDISLTPSKSAEGQCILHLRIRKLTQHECKEQEEKPAAPKAVEAPEENPFDGGLVQGQIPLE